MDHLPLPREQLIELTAQLCAASRRLCAESEALRESTAELVARTRDSVQAHRALAMRPLSLTLH